jgi:O-antigen/teichoic acid export membrane protein
MSSGFNVKVIQATKWSSITEVVAKLFAPVSTMVLARLLTPDMFGVVATITIVIAFAELFTDAGFQKYLIQHEFESREELFESTNVAFLTNLFLSIVIWGIIIIFRYPIAELLGNHMLGAPISIACVCIPLGAFSSIQMALFKRDFDFKTLFFIRLVSLVVPLIVTIPFAIIFRNYWALIIGTITLKLVNAILSTLRSNWKPKLQYSFRILKQMFSFTFWTVLESFSIWLSSYVGIIIVGMKLGDYYLGLYQTSITLVVSILSMISMAVTPVLFATLSRLQNNEAEFKKMFLSFQSTVALLVIPLGIGLFSYRKFITLVLLGRQWEETAGFIGLLGLIIALTIVYSHLCSEVYRSKGKPKLSLLLQFVFLIFFIPSITMAVHSGFKTLYIVHSVSHLVMVIVSSVLMSVYFNINMMDMLRGTGIKILVAGLMLLLSLLLQQVSASFFWNIFSIFVCISFYVGILFCIRTERDTLLKLKILIEELFFNIGIKKYVTNLYRN